MGPRPGKTEPGHGQRAWGTDRRVRVSSGLPSRLSLAALKFPWSHGNSTEEPGDTARPAAPKRDDKVGER